MSNDLVSQTKSIHNLFSEDKFDEVLNWAADDIQVDAIALGTVFSGKDVSGISCPSISNPSPIWC